MIGLYLGESLDPTKHHVLAAVSSPALTADVISSAALACAPAATSPAAAAGARAAAAAYFPSDVRSRWHTHRRAAK